MLTLRVNGIEYNQAISISFRRTLKELCGFFECETTATRFNILPVKIGDRIEVLADGVRVLNGYIERLTVNQGPTEHIINISGRDRTCDIGDSTVQKVREFIGPLPFATLARRVLDNGNMNYIRIVNEAGTIDDFTSGTVVSAEVGETIFDFLNKYAARQKFLLTTNGDGDLVFLRAQNAFLQLNLQRLQNNSGNNILSSSLDIDYTKRFYTYTAHSQENPIESSADEEQIVSSIGSSTDNEIRPSRNLDFITEEDETNIGSFNRAQFEANINRANSLNYKCVVHGHTINGSPYEINRLAEINDDFCQISAQMLLHTITMSYDLNNGSNTELEFTYQDAYTLQALRDQAEASRENTADSFVSDNNIGGFIGVTSVEEYLALSEQTNE